MTDAVVGAESLPPLSGEDAYCKSATMLAPLLNHPSVCPGRSVRVKQIFREFGRKQKTTLPGGSLTVALRICGCDDVF